MFLVYFAYVFANDITRVSRTRAYNAAPYETSRDVTSPRAQHKKATTSPQQLSCRTSIVRHTICLSRSVQTQHLPFERFWVTDSPAEKPSVCFGPAKSQDFIRRGWSIKRLTSSLNRLFFVRPSIHLEARATIHYQTTLYRPMAR